MTTKTATNDRDTLVREYREYRKRFNRAPNMWSVPNEREEAGFCLQHPAPIQIFENLTSLEPTPFWDRVRKLIEGAE